MPLDREGTLRTAEKLLRLGKLDAAIAEYRKVIDDQPSDWNTSNILGDLYFRAGQVDKAVAEYARIADHFANEGFYSKAVALYRKILKIQPDEERAMWQLGALAAHQGLLVDARSNFLALVERCRARGDERGEAEARVALGDLDGSDVDTRIAGARARVELGDTQTAVSRLKEFAADLQQKGKEDAALQLRIEAARLDPDDTDLLRELANELVRKGRQEDALTVLATAAERRGKTAGSAGGAAQSLWNVAETNLRGGRIAEGVAAIQKILNLEPGKRDTLVILGCSVGEVNPDAGFRCVEIVADAAIAADEWGSAAAALNEFVSRVPNHIPALMRLVEICVDGGLEATMRSAQVQLADAYLVAGAGAEARVIAEDLVAREPWERANLERFRQALALLGEHDIDGIIARRLSGQSPFTSTDVPWPAEVPADEVAQNVEPPAAKPESQEIDLSDVLGVLQQGELTESLPQIEDVLKDLRERALHPSSPEAAEQHLKLAESYVEMGMPADAIKALEVAARSPRHRFRAGAMLAKMYLDTGDPVSAIEWYEQAAEAPAPNPSAHHALLYDLGTALETQGEHARALAVLLELQADAGDYRDLIARLEHLTAELKR
jgi:tetratricopeptide (TPR) repeat protein